MTGVRRSFTNAATTVPKAAPSTTATARSTTLPRMMKSRNSLSMLAAYPRAPAGNPEKRGPGAGCRDRCKPALVRGQVAGAADAHGVVGVTEHADAVRAGAAHAQADRVARALG